MIPAYEKLAENLEGLADIAAIDCTQSFNRPICSRYDVQGEFSHSWSSILTFARISYAQVVCIQRERKSQARHW